MALRAADDEASWVDSRVALKATDDPDTRNGIDHASKARWHAYDRWGKNFGRAHEAAQVWFHRIRKRLKAGHERRASRAIGVLAHIIGDVAQPMHTDHRDRERSIHRPYERDVDLRIGYHFLYDGEQSVRPRGTTISVASQAHEDYFRLINAYGRRGYNRKVHRITKRQLRRAANALADLITSIK